VAAALACLGLVLSAQLRLRSEQAVVAEYEALGIAPATVDRSIQYGVIVLTLLGAAGGLAGALLAVRFTAALVAVSAGSGVALPSLEAQIPWPQVLGLLLVCAAVTIVAGWIVLRRVRFRPAAARMRA
jgi:ABC-type antimicrobial peptide transport system permease subunit